MDPLKTTIFGSQFTFSSDLHCPDRALMIQVAGGAYTMHTAAAATVRSSIRRLREIAEA